MRIYLSDYNVFVDEDSSQYIEMNNVLKFNEIAVKKAKIDAVITLLKPCDNWGDKSRIHEAIKMLENLKMIEEILSFFIKDAYKKRKDRIMKSCGCICYCPKCKDILNDQAKCTDTDLVRYECSCGHKSTWNFDIAPLPILLEDLKNDR